MAERPGTTRAPARMLAFLQLIQFIRILFMPLHRLGSIRRDLEDCSSTDAGATWSNINAGLETLINAGAPITALAVDPANPEVVYAGTSGNGIFRSRDGGANWTPFNEGLTNLDVRVLVIRPGRRGGLYASTSGGLFAVSNGIAAFRR